MAQLPPNYIPSNENILCLENTLEEILSPEDNKELTKYKYKPFKTSKIIARIIYNIIISSITIVFTIVNLAYGFKGNIYYKAYREYFVQIDEAYLTYLFGLESILPGYTQFWCDFGNFENGILVSFLIFTIFYLLFEIFSLLLHKSILSLSYQKGIFYQIILLTNIVFFFFFKIFFPLLLFSFIYSIFVLAKPPTASSSEYGSMYDNPILDVLNDEWDKKKMKLITNLVFKIFLFSFDIV